MFMAITDPGLSIPVILFSSLPSSGRDSQEHYKCCSGSKSGRSHRSNKFISIVTGEELWGLPVE